MTEDSVQKYRLDLLARHHALLNDCLEAGLSEEQTVLIHERQFNGLEKALLASMFREDERTGTDG